MPTSIATQTGDISSCVVAEQGVEPKIRIRVSVGGNSMFLELNAWQAQMLSEALDRDAQFARGFGEQG